jgi:4-carboxymuconolactone decarboxylase
MPQLPGFDEDAFERGLQTRREVIGSDYVDKALAGRDDFSEEFQQLVTQYCWNEIWNRPGLERRTRSMLNLAMLMALGRSQEFATHLRGAINNGVSKEEIKEVLLQATVYCGMPAGVDAFRVAKDVFREMGI